MHVIELILGVAAAIAAFYYGTLKAWFYAIILAIIAVFLLWQSVPYLVHG